jgi:cytidylate kinase
MDHLRRLVTAIDHRGNAVIIGRGAHCIVNSAHALRVRVVRPIEQRVEDYATQKGVSHQRALDEIRSGDKDRARFVRKSFNADVTDPTNYDIVINTGTYEPERAEALVLMAYLAKFGELPQGTPLG